MEETYSSADREVAAETHASGADEASAGWQREKAVDGGVGVGIIGLESLEENRGSDKASTSMCHQTYLVNLILVAAVGVLHVVLEGLWASEVVIGGGGGDDVALAGNLAGETGNRASDCSRELVDWIGWILDGRNISDAPW